MSAHSSRTSAAHAGEGSQPTLSLAQGLRSYFAMHRPPSQIPELDGLRAIAIVLVLLRHGINPYYEAGQPLLPIGGSDLAIPMVNGWAGVDLFFVLSGFLITAHLLRGWNATAEGISLSNYLSQRALRIVPAYYAVLAVAASNVVPYYEVRPEELGTRVGYHLLFLQDYLPSNIVVAFWSLGVEEKFYLTIPLLLMVLLRLRGLGSRCAVLCCLILVVPLARYATALAHPEVTSYGPFFAVFRSPFHLSVDALLMGALAAVLVRERARLAWLRDVRWSRALFWGGVLLVVSLFCSAPHMDGIGWFDKTLLFSALAIGFGAIVFGVVLSPGAHGPALRGYGLHVIARLSYSLYLVHLLVIPGVRVLLDAWLPMERLPAGGQFLVFLPVYLLASAVAALALYYAVERPFLLLKERMRRRQRAGEASGRVAAETPAAA